MKNSNAQWAILVGFIALLLAAWLLPPWPRPKARAARVSGVNNVASVSITLTNTLPTPTTNQ